MQNATSRGHGLGLCQATSDRLMKGREGREEGGGPHPLHPLPTGSQNRSSCMELRDPIQPIQVRGGLSVRWQGLCWAEDGRGHTSYKLLPSLWLIERTTTALGRGTENLDNQGRFPGTSAHLPAAGPGVRASPARARFPGYSSSASSRPGRGGPASERLRGSAPPKVGPQKEPGGWRGVQPKAAASAPRPQARGWHRALGKGASLGWGCTEPLPAQPRLSQPTGLRGPTLTRCGPPAGTQSIFPVSCDNTWPCLFNFLLYMVQRWARKLSLAPFDENIAAHTSCKDTHAEKRPCVIRKNASGPLLAAPGLGALGKLLGAKRGGCCWHTPPACPPHPPNTGPGPSASPMGLRGLAQLSAAACGSRTKIYLRSLCSGTLRR